VPSKQEDFDKYKIRIETFWFFQIPQEMCRALLIADRVDLQKDSRCQQPTLVFCRQVNVQPQSFGETLVGVKPRSFCRSTDPLSAEPCTFPEEFEIEPEGVDPYFVFIEILLAAGHGWL